MIKIGVVAYEMEGTSTGVGRYLEGLLNGIAVSNATLDGRPVEWRLFFKGDAFDHPLFDQHLFDQYSADPETLHRFRPVFDRRPKARPILWEQLRLPALLRRQPLDLLFCPSNALPPGRHPPSVVTVHDLSFEHLPGEFDFKERWRRRVLARRAVHRADRVLADTQTMAQDIAQTYGVAPHKIGIVPLALDDRFRLERPSAADDEAARLAELGVRPPYLLYLGSIFDRRRLDLVIDAYSDRATSHPDLQLVIAGTNRLRQPRQLEDWIRDSAASHRIVRLGYVPEDLLDALYQQAELSFYLSTYEGFGLPPLESLALGTPAIVSPALAFDDLWPDYPYRCSPLEATTVRAITRRAFENPDERRRIVGVGQEKLRPLTWQKSAEGFLAELARVIA